MSTRSRRLDISGGFLITPRWLIDAVPSSQRAHALAVWAALWHFADGTTHECWPSREQIAERAGLSTSTVKRTLRCLRDVGAVTVTSQHDRRQHVTPTGFARQAYQLHLDPPRHAQ